MERLYCSICKCDIKKYKCFPVIDGDNINCSDCVKMAIYFHKGMVSEEQFKLLPKYVRKYCIEYHIRKLKENNEDLLDDDKIKKLLTYVEEG